MPNLEQEVASELQRPCIASTD